MILYYGTEEKTHGSSNADHSLFIDIAESGLSRSSLLSQNINKHYLQIAEMWLKCGDVENKNLLWPLEMPDPVTLALNLLLLTFVAVTQYMDMGPLKRKC